MNLLSAESKVSAMRFSVLMMVTTACICLLALIFNVCIKLYGKVPVNMLEVAALVAALATFATAALKLKQMQKKNELENLKNN